MSKLSFRARALDATKPMPIYHKDELSDLQDYSILNRAVPQMPSGMEKEEESVSTNSSILGCTIIRLWTRSVITKAFNVKNTVNII